LGKAVIDENGVLCLIDFGLKPIMLLHGVDCKIKKSLNFHSASSVNEEL
jgi:hypothetical protein